MAILTLEPNDVLTALADRPRSEKRALKVCIRVIRGRSSAITTHVRNDDRFTCFNYKHISRPVNLSYTTVNS